VSAPVFVEDEGVNSGAEVEGVEVMVCERILPCFVDSTFCELQLGDVERVAC
jgi:hypothetical protein